MVFHLKSPLLNKIPIIRHGFFGRRDGVSKGYFSSLNVNRFKGDSDDNVYKNREIICREMGFDSARLCTLEQTHSVTVIEAQGPFEKGNLPKGDALITQEPGLLIGIQTADCVPILMVDETQKCIAAVHGGWRGAVGGIIGETLKKMKNRGCNLAEIKAAIGPCIWQISYEVGEELRQTVLEVKPEEGEKYFIKGDLEGKYLFDLPRYVFDELKAGGVQHISLSPANTFTQEGDFFSFRRKTLNQEPDFGCQLSVIGLL